MSDRMNPVKIYSARDRVEADLLVQALINQYIPAYRQGAAGGDYMDIYMGNSVYGENIYVDEKDKDAAMEIIESIVTPVEQGEEGETYEDEDQPRRRRPIVVRVIAVVVIAALVAAVVVSLTSCGNKVSTKEIKWPESGLATMLPEPTTLRGEISKNNYDLFSADISKSKEDDYEEYVEACKDEGFTVDAEEGDEKFSAFNEDGYILTLTYHSNEKYFEINLEDPWFEAGSTFSWPTTGLGALLPEPSSHVGSIKNDESDFFNAYIGESTIDDYNDYIDECIDAGFDVANYRTDTHFNAKNEAGNYLSIIYEGFNTFYIELSVF